MYNSCENKLIRCESLQALNYHAHACYIDSTMSPEHLYLKSHPHVMILGGGL
jgi:hypothetical protein